MNFRSPKDRSTPNLMLGAQIVLEYLAGPAFDNDKPDENVSGPLQAKTGLFWLQAQSSFGIDVSKEQDGDDRAFIPWGAVLAMYGPSRTELEDWASEELQENRADLLERLRKPQPEDMATLSQDATDYLSHNPNDTEVRQAQRDLPESFRYPWRE